MRSAAIGSYFVLVLECLQRVNLIHTQRQGSRFGAKSRHPRNIRHNAHPAETYEIRRLPGTSARIAALSAPLRSTQRRSATLGQRMPWVIRGSRLLPTGRAAILQSGSPPGAGYVSASPGERSNRGRERGRRPGRERSPQRRPSSLHQRSLTKSRFLARYERPEKKVNATATESTNVPIAEAMFWAVGER